MGFLIGLEDDADEFDDIRPRTGAWGGSEVTRVLTPLAELSATGGVVELRGTGTAGEEDGGAKKSVADRDGRGWGRLDTRPVPTSEGFAREFT